MGVNSMGPGGSNKTFFNIFAGKIILEYDKKEDLLTKLNAMGQDPEPHGHHKGIQERKKTKGVNEGKVVFYYEINDLSGVLTKMELRETDFGEFLSIELDDVGEVFVISLGDVFGRHSKDFIRRLEDLDLSKELAVGTWESIADNGNTYAGVRLYQDGKKIEYFLKREDLPPPTQKTKGSKTIWDFSEQDDFLYKTIKDYIEGNFTPNTQSNDPPASQEKKQTSVAQNKKSKVTPPIDDIPPNDLPF